MAQNIHKKLKDIGLHLENELFLLNKEYDFYFYTQILKEYEIIDLKDNQTSEVIIKDDIYKIKRNHILDFIIKIYEKFTKSEKRIVIFYSKKEDLEKIWKFYLTFCIEKNQYYGTKSIFKKSIQSRFIVIILLYIIILK